MLLSSFETESLVAQVSLKLTVYLRMILCLHLQNARIWSVNYHAQFYFHVYPYWFFFFFTTFIPCDLVCGGGVLSATVCMWRTEDCFQLVPFPPSRDWGLKQDIRLDRRCLCPLSHLNDPISFLCKTENCNLSPWEMDAGRSGSWDLPLDYIVSLKPAWATWDSASKTLMKMIDR